MDAYKWTDTQYPWNRQAVYAFCEDRDGNAWVGCYQSGLVFLKGKTDAFHYIDLNKNSFAAGKLLTSTFIDRSGRWYIGIDGDGMYEIDNQGNMQHHLFEESAYQLQAHR